MTVFLTFLYNEKNNLHLEGFLLNKGGMERWSGKVFWG
jgi:hypothetical protein